MLGSKTMRTFIQGKTKIEVYGGFNTVGGNCIVINSPSLKVMLDQGVNFTQLKKFYGFSIQPDSVEELREMKVLPLREAYDGVEEVYITHLHLDHLGSLNIPGEIQTYLPSKDVAEILSKSWWFGWKQHLLPKTLSFLNFRDLEESKKVQCARVSHSAFPSYALRVDTDDASILYTGDLRLSTPHNVSSNSLESLEKLSRDGIDVLIVEGTNFGRRMNYLTPSQFKTLLRELLEKYKRKLLFISTHSLDLEVTLTILELLWKSKYIPIFENIYYAQLLDIMISKVNYTVDKELLFTPRTSKVRVLENFEIALLEELKDVKKAIFVPMYAIKDLKTIAELSNETTDGLVHIIVTGEPLSEEWIIEERKIINWLKLLGITSYRIHLSGHYHPYEFKEIIQVVKPKKVIPVHTTAPRTIVQLFNRLR